jgi:hypothetical protein
MEADPQSIQPGCATTSPARDPSSSDVSTIADLPGGPFAERKREVGMERTSVGVEELVFGRRGNPFFFSALKRERPTFFFQSTVPLLNEGS